jgi:hypothetical protein
LHARSEDKLLKTLNYLKFYEIFRTFVGAKPRKPRWISSWEEAHPNREGEFITIAIVFAIVYSLMKNTLKRRVSYGRTAHYFGRFALCGAAQHVGGAHRQEV